VGRLQGILTVTAQITISQVICQDEDEVWLPGDILPEWLVAAAGDTQHTGGQYQNDNGVLHGNLPELLF
jgi:hypothetical protein